MGRETSGAHAPLGVSSDRHERGPDTIRRLEETGSPVVTDGEQTKPSFATYPLDGAIGLAPDGVVIPFEDGHTRQLPRLTAGPFRYATYASTLSRRGEATDGDPRQASCDFGFRHEPAVSRHGAS